MIAFGIMLVLAGIIVLIAAAAQAAQNRAYAACSESASATVTRKRSRKVKNGVSYELTVSYVVDGATHECVVGALQTEYDSIAEGNRIEVRYRPSRPNKAVRPREQKPQVVRILLYIGIGLSVLGAVLYFIGRM